MTTHSGMDRGPLWSPDGQRVAFLSDRGGQQSLYWRLVDGTGEAEHLMTSAGATCLLPAAWSADGQTLVYWDLREKIDVGLLSIVGERRSQRLLATEFAEGAPSISPDGGWIAYQSNETGQNQVYVQRFPGLGGKQTISTDGGQEPVWSPAGGELFYRRSGRHLMVVPVETEPTFSAGDPEPLFEWRYHTFLASRTYDVAPNGQRFLVIKEGASDEPLQIILVQNWTDELQRLVPTP